MQTIEIKEQLVHVNKCKIIKFILWDELQKNGW